MRLPAVLALLAAGCTVPSIGELSPKRCDGTHACVAGFTCSAAGVCEASSGGPCTGSETKACGSDQGECKLGTQKCTGGMLGPCEGAVGPTEELCDGKNNDCDDETDEGLFDTNPCELVVGVCQNKKHACVAGSFEATCGAASYGADWEAFESTCDGKDNDCDGTTDESGGACVSMGVCAGHMMTCAGLCVAPQFESPEASCDGRDNDCDGLTDEGLTNGVSCNVSAGVCAGKTRACVGDGGYEPVCTATSYGPTYEASESRCDGLDNDCNGSVDRRADGGALPASGACELQSGVCNGAQRACVDGGPETLCTAASYPPTFEAFELTCDGLDNDCDGRPDRSRELALATGPTTQTQPSVLPTTGGLALVYADDNNGTKKVFFRSVPFAGTAGAPVELAVGGATSATSPSMTSAGSNEGVVVWLDDLGGPRLVAARVNLGTGAAVWSRALVFGVGPFFGTPRAAALPGGNIAVVWMEARTAGLYGIVLEPSQGNVVTSRTLLSTPTLSDGGFVEQVLSADVAGRADGGFEVAWTAFQAGDSYARFKRWNTGLTDAGTFTQSFAVARSARLSAEGPDVTGAFLVAGSASTDVKLRDSSGVFRQIDSTTDNVNEVDVSNDFVVWTEGLLARHLKGKRLNAATTNDYTPAAGAPLNPSVRALNGGFFTAYEIDKDAGFDIYGQFICP